MGYPHPDYLLEDLTAFQLAEWEAFDKLDPIGSFRDDYRAAHICSTNTNIAIHTNKSKKSKPVKLTTPLDFMPDWTGDLKALKHKKQSTEEMKSVLLGIAHTQNSKVKRKLHNRTPTTKQNKEGL